jgi:hypothetical protein
MAAFGSSMRGLGGGSTGREVMVVETGVDPVTPRFSGVCSAN